MDNREQYNMPFGQNPSCGPLNNVREPLESFQPRFQLVWWELRYEINNIYL